MKIIFKKMIRKYKRKGNKMKALADGQRWREKEVGLSNRSGRVGFVLGSKLNRLKTPRPEPDLFNKRVQKPDLNPFNF